MAKLGNFARGRYELKNPNKYIGTRTPMYRSSWEWQFMKLCDEHPSVAKWASESIKIPYRNPLDGKYTVYVPDFFIVYSNKKGKTKANRFIEKNLVRKFIVFWDVFSEKKFLSQQQELNYDTCDCFLECAKKISESYPEIEWFKDCEIDFTQSLFENI